MDHCTHSAIPATCVHWRNYFLCSPGYDIFEREPVKDSLVSVPDVASGLGKPPLRLGCFYMLVFVPITCALLQLASWSRFTLHGRKLQGIKTLRQGAQHGNLIDVKAIWTEKSCPKLHTDTFTILQSLWEEDKTGGCSDVFSVVCTNMNLYTACGCADSRLTNPTRKNTKHKKKNCLIFYIKILTYIYIEQMTKSRTNQSFWM